MPSLYLHPRFNPCSQEHTFVIFKKFTPLTLDKLAQHFELVKDMEKADYYSIGQISDYLPYNPELLEFASKYPRKTIVDVEGDWFKTEMPAVLKKCIICVSGPGRDWGFERYFTRPPMSTLLAFLYENSDARIRAPFDQKTREFHFQGKVATPNRAALVKTLAKSKLPHVVATNTRWSGLADLNSDSVRSYVEGMNRYLFSLCPKGEGGSSVRFYEACFFGNVPIILGNDALLGESWHDTSFAFRITDYNNQEAIITELERISRMETSELRARAARAREYYSSVIKPFFDDSAGVFMKWLLKEGKMED